MRTHLLYILALLALIGSGVNSATAETTIPADATVVNIQNQNQGFYTLVWREVKRLGSKTPNGDTEKLVKKYPQINKARAHYYKSAKKGDQLAIIIDLKNHDLAFGRIDFAKYVPKGFNNPTILKDQAPEAAQPLQPEPEKAEAKIAKGETELTPGKDTLVLPKELSPRPDATAATPNVEAPVAPASSATNTPTALPKSSSTITIGDRTFTPESFESMGMALREAKELFPDKSLMSFLDPKEKELFNKTDQTELMHFLSENQKAIGKENIEVLMLLGKEIIEDKIELPKKAPAPKAEEPSPSASSPNPSAAADMPLPEDLLDLANNGLEEKPVRTAAQLQAEAEELEAALKASEEARLKEAAAAKAKADSEAIAAANNPPPPPPLKKSWWQSMPWWGWAISLVVPTVLVLLLFFLRRVGDTNREMEDPDDFVREDEVNDQVSRSHESSTLKLVDPPELEVVKLVDEEAKPQASEEEIRRRHIIFFVNSGLVTWVDALGQLTEMEVTFLEEKVNDKGADQVQPSVNEYLAKQACLIRPPVGIAATS